MSGKVRFCVDYFGLRFCTCTLLDKTGLDRKEDNQDKKAYMGHKKVYTGCLVALLEYLPHSLCAIYNL